MRHAPHVLITGAAGFIGSATASVLLREGVRVTGLDDLSAPLASARMARLSADHSTTGMVSVQRGGWRFAEQDVRDRESLLDLVLGGPDDAFGPVDAILHLAGRVGVRRVLEDPVGCEAENLDAGRAVAAVVRQARGRGRRLRVLAASTSEVYAESSQPLSEDSNLRPLVAEGRWRYAASKLAAERSLDQAGGGVVHLRFFNVVGPGQDADSGMVLPRFIEAARAGVSLPVHGHGRQVRTLAHVDAVARDLAALTAPEAFVGTARILGFAGPLNVGGTARTTIGGLAELVAQAVAAETGRPVAAQRLVDPSIDVGGNFEDVRHRVPDLTRLRSLGLASEGFGSQPWSLESLVRDTVQRHALEASPCELPAF
ncbi:MAG: NAD-dependent epimerase/dehydratase family protein [Planctomycetota bacterium]